MTVSIESTSKSTNGNGSVTNFPYDFKIFQASDLTVIVRAANGTETVLSQTSPVQYTITNVGADTGGFAVISDTSLTPSGTTVVCVRTAELKQQTDYTPNDPFPAASHEDALDKLTMQIQQVNDKAERSIKISRTNTMTSKEFTASSTDRANKVLAFDASGELSVTQEIGTFKGNSATTTTAAFKTRDIIKSTTAAQLNNIYICVADSVAGDVLTDTDHFELLVDAFSAASSSTTATTKAAEALASANAAAGSLTTFQNQYHGAASSNPSANLDAGDLYFKTDGSGMKVYTGSVWTDVKPTSSEQTNINAVAAVDTEIASLAPSANITAMGLLGTSGNVTAMGLLGTSSNIANMGTLTASGVIANIATVASRDTDIGVVSSADTNIATVAGQISPTNNIATVAGKAPLITSDFISDLNLINSTFVSQMNLVTSDFVTGISLVTADFIADVNQLATNDFISDLNSLANADFISDLNQVEQIKADVSVVASNVTGVNSFAERYRVGSSDPSSSNDEGDLFYNSTSNTVRFYNGSAWVAIEASTTTTINNNADNRIITGSGTSNTLEGEANLTYDGTSLLVGNDGVIKFDPTDSNTGSNVIIGQPRPANMTAGVNRSVTIVGKDNFTSVTTGIQNVVMGHRNATGLTSGSNNFIIGYENMRGTNGSDTNNVIIGYQNFHSATYRSLSNVLIGSYNHFGASDDNDFPENNIGIGRSNLYHNQENYNIAIGFANLQNNDYNSTGWNVAIGYECLKNVHRATRNVAIGYRANHQTSGTSTNNINNVSIGYNAMRFGEGSNHVAIGRDALENSDVSSSGNVAIGDSAMENSTSADSRYNVSIGQQSGSNIGGMYNNLIGYGSGNLLSGVYFNNYTGMYSGYSSNSGITLDLRSSSTMVVHSSLASYIHHASGIQSANFGNPSEKFPNFSHFTANGTNFTGVTHLTYNTSGQDHYRFFNANGDVGSISTNGTSTVYSTSSDHRLKENVNYTFDATTRLKQLKPARFNFIADGSDNTVDGFLAHEVMSIVPEAVIGTHNGTKEEEYVKKPAVYKDVVKPEEVDEDGNVLKEEKTFQELVTEQVLATRTVPDYQKLDQAKLVPLLTKTILELEARITALENA
tara:strand:+ start:178 stop:3513 length:3336 start_codon:yes stop_codon:yes gene_type:complete